MGLSKSTPFVWYWSGSREGPEEIARGSRGGGGGAAMTPPVSGRGPGGGAEAGEGTVGGGTGIAVRVRVGSNRGAAGGIID